MRRPLPPGRLPAIPAAAPAEKTFELAIEVAPQLFEIGRALIAAAGPPSPLRIVERHQHPAQPRQALSQKVAGRHNVRAME